MSWEQMETEIRELAVEHAPTFQNDEQQDRYETYVDRFINCLEKAEFDEDLFIDYVCAFMEGED